MIRRMTFKQFLFILPLLALIAVFSLYPIVTSVTYGFFDYRTNDQQYNDFYLGNSFNPVLFVQNVKYVDYYLAGETPQFPEEAAAELAAIGGENAGWIARYENAEGNLTLGDGEMAELSAYIESLQVRVDALYTLEPAGGEYYMRENLDIIIEDLETSFITSNFVGGRNYATLAQDTRFYRALWQTVLFTVVSVVLEFVLGMMLALIMNRAIRGIGLVRTAGLLPWAIPTAVSAMIWKYMYDGDAGIIAKIFSEVGIIGSQADMLLTRGGAMGAAILADVWKTTPYMALLLLAGLQVIDRGLYESAAIDGSGTLRTFFQITLPLMKPSIMVALLFRTLDAFRVYDLIALLTGGGPGNGTETLSVYAYQVMFGQSNYGYGSVIVVGMFICVAIIAIVYVKLLGAEVIGNESR